LARPSPDGRSDPPIAAAGRGPGRPSRLRGRAHDGPAPHERGSTMRGWSKATLDDIEWQLVEGFAQGWMKFLGDSLDEGPWVLQVRHAPDYVEAKHWHEADTVYIFTAGEMHVEGE